MVLQVPWNWVDLLWIVTLLDVSMTSTATPTHVKCNLGNPAGGGVCSCWEVQWTGTPWPPHDTPVAPAPRSATLEMDYYGGKLFPEIGWIVDRKHVRQVDGFYMELLLVPNYYKYYQCSHNVSTILKDGADGPIVYNFDGCCRSLYGGFITGDELTLAIFSLPLYDVGDEPNYTRVSLTVEEDEDDDQMRQLNEWQKIHMKLKSLAEEKSSTLSDRNPKNHLLKSDQD